jgi:hypothetical protein
MCNLYINAKTGNTSCKKKKKKKKTHKKKSLKSIKCELVQKDKKIRV